MLFPSPTKVVLQTHWSNLITEPNITDITDITDITS